MNIKHQLSHWTVTFTNTSQMFQATPWHMLRTSLKRRQSGKITVILITLQHFDIPKKLLTTENYTQKREIVGFSVIIHPVITKI